MEIVVAQGEGNERSMCWELEIIMLYNNCCKLLYIEWINSKVPVYSRGLYSMSCDKPNGKENEKDC